jgi:hypothetical protein
LDATTFCGATDGLSEKDLYAIILIKQADRRFNTHHADLVQRLNSTIKKKKNDRCKKGPFKPGRLWNKLFNEEGLWKEQL